MKISKKILSLVDNLRDFLRHNDQANNGIQIPLGKSKVEVASTNLKDNLFTHSHENIIEYTDRSIRISFRFGSNRSCILSNQKFEPFILRESVNFNHPENHRLRKN